jgi:hypothetical protein
MPKNGEPTTAPAPLPKPEILIPSDFLTPKQEEILRRSALCSRLDDNQIDYFFEVIRRTRLDPFTGQIRADIRNSKDPDDRNKKIPTLILITTLQGLRVLAERTGHHQGEEGPQWCGTNGDWVDVWLPEAPPAAARAKIFRNDRDRAQGAVVRWDAFVQMEWGTGGQLQVGLFWKKMGSHMLGKCALAGCYRAAYPDPCSGLYIPEELAQELDPDSEEAIEAEMANRARREKEYWEKKNAEGVYSVDQSQQREKEVFEAGKRSSNVIPMSTETAETNGKNGQNHETNGANQETTEPPDYDRFVITRIEAFRGRTVGSLTKPEVVGIRTWLDRAHERWDQLDENLKEHYMALVDRYNRDQTANTEAEPQLETFPDGLDLTQV